MLKIAKARYVVLLACCALGVTACGKSAEDKEVVTPLTDTSGLLRYVPADSPYVFGTLAPLPDEFMDTIEPKLDRLLAAYSRMLGAAFAQAGTQEELGGSDDLEKMSAVVEEVRSMMSLEGLSGAGITRDSTVILYGNGLLPVLRMTLTTLRGKPGGKVWRFKGVAEVDGEMAAECEFTAMMDLPKE